MEKTTPSSRIKGWAPALALAVYAVLGYAAPMLAASTPASKNAASSTSKSTGVASSAVGVPSPIGYTDVPTLIGRVLSTAIGAAGTVALVMFVYAGIKMMTAQGNSEKFESGKKTMIWAVFGLLGVFVSYALVRLVLSALGAT